VPDTPQTASEASRERGVCSVPSAAPSNNSCSPASRPRKHVWWRAAVLAVPFFILGLGVGGYFLFDHYTHVQPAFIAMFNEHMVEQYAQLQYEQASYPEAQLALERYLRLLLDPKPSPNPLSDARMRRVDAALTLGRLALLHERNGRPDLAAACWARAEVLARQATWKDPSREHIRSVLLRIDSWATPTPTPRAAS